MVTIVVLCVPDLRLGGSVAMFGGCGRTCGFRSNHLVLMRMGCVRGLPSTSNSMASTFVHMEDDCGNYHEGMVDGAA